jgi:hypothetical protein
MFPLTGLPLSEGVGVPTLWWGSRDFPIVTVGMLSLCTVGGRPPSTCRVVKCHSVEELGFHRWDSPVERHSGKCWASVPLGCRPSGATYWVAAYSFPSLSGESGILALWLGCRCSPTVRDNGEPWASVYLGSQASWQLQSSGLHLEEDLGLQLLHSGDQTLLWEGAAGMAGLLSTLGIQAFLCCPLSSRLLLSSHPWGIWCCHSLKDKQSFSHGRAWWEELDLFVS